MLQCLACRSKLIQAFLQLQHKFLVCRTCFHHFLTYYNNNAFNRISLLNGRIPSQLRKLHTLYLRFIESQNISTENIFNFKFVDLYDNYISQKYQSQELSTEYSCTESDQFTIQQKTKFNLYNQYSWVKEKLQENYANIKTSKLGEKVTQNILPAKQKIMEKGNLILNSVSYLKKEFKSLQVESPTFKQLKSIDIGGLFRSKYKSFF